MSVKIESFLILHNIAKGSNFGFLIRTANAFGAEVIVVGRKHFSRRGANAKTRYTRMHRFYTLQEAVEFTRARGCQICGVEIAPDALPVTKRPFERSTAFMVGNEGEGLSPKQMEMCDKLIYVPQHGTAVSLNVNVAGAIVLHHFAQWAEFTEAPRAGHQFQGPPPNHQEFREEVSESSLCCDSEVGVSPSSQTSNQVDR